MQRYSGNADNYHRPHGVHQTMVSFARSFSASRQHSLCGSLRFVAVATLSAASLVTAASAAELSTDAKAAIPHDVQQIIVVDYRAMQNSPAAMNLKERILPPELKRLETALKTSGLKVAMNSTQTRAGTISVGTTDTVFGARFAYYIGQINQKLAAQWYVGMLDSQASGHRVYLSFQVARDGTPSHIKIEQRSGDATLDQTALNALQHVDTFGPLPDAYQGSYVNVQYYFEAPPHP